MKVLGVSKPMPSSAPHQQKCYVLGYNQGYANLSTTNYLAVKNTANKGACCTLCLRDSRCVAWTRVAGETTWLAPALARKTCECWTQRGWCCSDMSRLSVHAS